MASARASQDLSSASEEQLLRIKEELLAPMLHERVRLSSGGVGFMGLRFGLWGVGSEVGGLGFAGLLRFGAGV